MRKVPGFASYSANLFCSFCYLKKKDIEILDSSKWKLQLLRNTSLLQDIGKPLPHLLNVIKSSKNQVHGIHAFWNYMIIGIQSQEALSASRTTSVKACCQTIFVESEVLERSRYCPNRKLSRQMIHPNPLLRAKKKDSPIYKFLNDSEDILEDLTGLVDEAVEYNQNGLAATQLRMKFYCLAGLQVPETGAEILDQPGNSDNDHGAKYHDHDWVEGASDHESVLDQEEGDKEQELKSNTKAKDKFQGIFRGEEMQFVREWIALEILTWIERPLINLGSASHGKLKADTWFVLFTVCLPLILLIIWTGQTDRTEHWRNFAFLITFTNIACAYSLTDDLIDLGEDAEKAASNSFLTLLLL
ncbi:hypothetical protein BT69DRAFT_1297305 [Atractiella rhizophila]|nr:hypothetical protein BT69DRAFT_1297305 [Atractiella rhizophila]